MTDETSPSTEELKADEFLPLLTNQLIGLSKAEVISYVYSLPLSDPEKNRIVQHLPLNGTPLEAALAILNVFVRMDAGPQLSPMLLNEKRAIEHRAELTRNGLLPELGNWIGYRPEELSVSPPLPLNEGGTPQDHANYNRSVHDALYQRGLAPFPNLMGSAVIVAVRIRP